MNTNLFLRRASCLLVATSLSLAATTQDLQGSVTIDRNAGLATYRFDITGPPNGTGFTLASLLLAPQPIQIQPALNLLFLDPFLGGPLHILPLGPLGRGLDQLPVPLPIAQGLPVMMQAVVLEPGPAGRLAFTDLAVAVPFTSGPSSGVAGSYNDGVYSVGFTGYGPGSPIEVSVNGGAPVTGTIDGAGNGRIDVPMPGGPQRGDAITVKVNGVTVATWRH
jgi:hypothetical protein